MNFTHRYPLNVPGRFYVDDQCTDCDLCRELAPDNIRRDDRFGQSYVYKQPETDAEVAAVQEGVDGCPTEAVRSDGDLHDWEQAPIIDWRRRLEGFNREVVFEVGGPIIPYEDTLEEERLAMEQWRAKNQTSRWRKILSRLLEAV